MIPLARTGLPKSIIKKYGISKKAWAVYRGSRKGSPRTTTKKVRNLVRRRRSYSRKRRRRGPRTIPVLPMLSLAPPIIRAAEWIKDPLAAGDFKGVAYNAAYSLLKDFAGYDLNENRWTGGNMFQTYGAMIAGYAGHKIATMLGVNRIFARLPRPLNRLRL